jgi:hypothetical protein
MTDAKDNEPQTRWERLAAIAAEYTEETHQPRAERQLAGVEPVWRYVAVSSEGSPESRYASNGNLIVAESTAELAELLRQECGEGWVAHGRLWDLDGSWHLWGILEIAYSVRVGEECTRPVQMVRVEGREDGIYLFDDRLDAETFARAVGRRGAEAGALRGANPRPPWRRPADRHRARLSHPERATPPDPGTAEPCARTGIARHKGGPENRRSRDVHEDEAPSDQRRGAGRAACRRARTDARGGGGAP